MTSEANARVSARLQSKIEAQRIGRCRRNPRPQRPNPKEPPKSKLQKRKLLRAVTWYLGFGICLELGIWRLELVRRYGVAAAVAAGEAAGAGEPKLNCTFGAFSAPCWAAKNGRVEKPNIPAIVFVGKRRTAVLYS